MAEHEEEEEIFEINDFTNATEWESFIADIEKVFHQWGLAASDDHSNEGAGVAKQHRKVERVNYCGRTFVISLEVGGASGSDHAHSQDGSKKAWSPAMREMMDPSCDFPPKAHHLTRWYGLSQFVLIAPGEGESALTSQAQAKLMISSISVAVSNTSCVTPVFVQVHQKWRQLYVGVCECGDVRVDFDMVHLRHTPPHFGHLTGLLDLFKSKLKSPVEQPVQIAVRYTYVLNHWSVDDWPVEPLAGLESEEGGVNYQSLSFGAISDPIRELHLSAVWPNLSEELIADSETHSVLKPSHAPMWGVVCQLADGCSCLLSEQLTEFFKLCYRNESVGELLGSRMSQDSSLTGTPGFSKALSRLTTLPAANMASPFLPTRVVGSGDTQTPPTMDEVLSDAELDRVFKCLFPEAFQTSSENQPPLHTSTPSQRHTSTPSHKSGTSSHQDPLVTRLKSAPRDSLTSRLANTLCVVNHEHGLRALALVWYELVQELRYRWENGVPLRDLHEGHPDMACCLLHQKLQMLNCCIRHKLSHEQKLHTPNVNSNSRKSDLRSKIRKPDVNSSLEYRTPNTSIRQTAVSKSRSHDSKGGSHDSGSDSDEFFEAMESQDGEVAMDTEQSLKDGPGDGDPGDPGEGGNVGDPGEGVERVGALEPCGDLVLVATGNRLYIPVTQDHTPMTEDMLTEQANVLSRLGTSEEAARVRAKMQSSSLLSDMQAFKAANPGCLLDDFVRWYSPRDWIEGKSPPREATPTATPTTQGQSEERQSTTDNTPDDDGLQQPEESHDIVQGSSEKPEESHDIVQDSGDPPPPSKFDVDADSAIDEDPTDSAMETADSADGGGWEEEEWAVIESDGETEEETKKETNEEPPRRYVNGHLSARMLLPDNLWVETWSSAHSLPAYKQKRLFDDTREAEKLLHFMAGLSPAGLALLLMPVLLHSALVTIRERQEKRRLAAVDSLLQDVVSLLSTEQQPTLDSLPKYQECISLLSQAEHLLASAHSLRTKLHQGLELSGEGVGDKRSEIDVSTEMILSSPELVLTDPTSSVTGRALRGLLTAQSAVTDMDGPFLSPEQAMPLISADSFPQPSGKEYILRTVLPRPTHYSNHTPQRMFCVLTGAEFRLTGAFSQDTKLT